MATIGVVQVGLRLDAAQFLEGLEGADRSLVRKVASWTPLLIRVGLAASGAGVSMGGVAGAAGLLAGLAGPAALIGGVAALGVGAFGAVKGLDSVTMAAADFNETINKVGTTFGDSTGVVIAQAQEMSVAFGIPQTGLLESAANLGQIAKGAGLSKAEAAKLANSMVKLATDASSFHNVPVDVALEKIRAGLVGESEPMRAFGVDMLEGAVKAEALRLGMTAVGGTLTNTQKVMARASLITKGLSDAQGDLAKTAGSATNRLRAIEGRGAIMALDIGLAIKPFTDFGILIKDKVSIAAVGATGILRDTSLAIQRFAGLAGDAVPPTAAEAKAIQAVSDAALKTQADVTKLTDDLKQQVATFGMSSTEVDIYKLSLAGATEEQLAGARAVSAQLEGMEASKKAMADMDAKVKQITESVKTPAEAFNAEFAELNQLLALGAIGFDTFALAVAKAKEKLDQDTGVTKQLEELKGAAEATFNATRTPLEIHQKTTADLEKQRAAGLIDEETFTRARGQADEKLSKDTGLDDLKSKAEDVAKSVQTPMEAFQARMRELQELRTAGLLSSQDFDRAGLAAAKEALPTDTGPKFAGALELGSQEARSAILNFQQGKDTTAKDTLETAKKQLAALEGLRADLTRSPLGAEADEPFEITA